MGLFDATALRVRRGLGDRGRQTFRWNCIRSGVNRLSQDWCGEERELKTEAATTEALSRIATVVLRIHREAPKALMMAPGGGGGGGSGAFGAL